MKIEAYKCEQTGRIFENEGDFIEHGIQLEKSRALEALRAELLPRIKALQAQPFLGAGTVKLLASRLVEVYPELSALLEKCELLPDELVGNVMQKAEVISSELRATFDTELYDWSPNFGAEADSPEATRGLLFELRVLFNFEKELTTCPVNLMQSVFPLLNSRAYLNTDDTTAAGHAWIEVYAEPFLATMPTLLAKYRLFESLPPTRDAEAAYSERIDEQLCSDAVHQKFVTEEDEVRADIAALERRMEKLKGQLSDIDLAKKTRRGVVADELISEFPLLKQYWSLFADLSMC